MAYAKTALSFDTKALAAVLPTIVAWRLRVFYAPHYSLMDFPIRKLHDKSQALSRGTTPESHALYGAGELLGRISKHLSKLDIKAIATAYTIELNVDASRGCLYKSRTSRNPATERPVTNIIKRVSEHTDIPERQLSRSLLLLAQYEQYSTQEETNTSGSEQSPPYSSSSSSKTAYSPTTPKRLAQNKDYDTLSKVVLEDMEDIHYFKIFPVNTRHKISRMRDIYMYRHAVRRCLTKYFSALEYTKRDLKAHPEVPRWTCDVDKCDLRVEKKASSSIGLLFSRFCIAIDKFVRGRRFISFEHRWMIVYELSQAEIDRHEKGVVESTSTSTSTSPSELSTDSSICSPPPSPPHQIHSTSQNTSTGIRELICRCHSVLGKKLGDEVVAERATGARSVSRWFGAKRPVTRSTKSLRSDPYLTMFVPLDALEEDDESTSDSS